jgi:Pyruvate/2-oxoacid:ferredoxin oxidoreductase gamma subunit
MTERELLLTGIGGQGVQLAAQVIARAATLEGRNVALFGVYGGMMRGGNTDATVVVGDGPLQAPPLVSHSWSAIAMHDEFWEPLAPKLRPRALVLVNDATFTTALDTDAYQVFRILATEIAAQLTSRLGASMVMVGAYVGITGIVGLDAAIAAMQESIPPYRRQHVAANEVAIRAGYDSVEHLAVPAWDEGRVNA